MHHIKNVRGRDIITVGRECGIPDKFLNVIAGHAEDIRTMKKHILEYGETVNQLVDQLVSWSSIAEGMKSKMDSMQRQLQSPGMMQAQELLDHKGSE